MVVLNPEMDEQPTDNHEDQHVRYWAQGTPRMSVDSNELRGAGFKTILLHQTLKLVFSRSPVAFDWGVVGHKLVDSRQAADVVSG
jgi:hypothetical protein